MTQLSLMKFSRSSRFKKDFQGLDPVLQNLVKEKFSIFKSNPDHPSFDVQPMQGFKGIFEGHITDGLVFTFEKDFREGEIIYLFRRIGTHKVYKNP